MFCQQCGTQISDDAVFCTMCGVPLSSVPTNPASFRSTDRGGIGFSEKIHDISIQTALKKGRIATVFFAFVLFLAPFVILFAISVMEGEPMNVAQAVWISGAFIIASLLYKIVKSAEGMWDGTVVDKYTKVKHDNKSEGYATCTYYIVEIRKDRGGRKKLEEREHSKSFASYYDYLQIGDRVRYHPQFNCYYEKYDKSRDTYAICPICSTKNAISRDRCSRCHVVVIK